VELLIFAQSQDNGARNSARCQLIDAVTLGRGPESLILLDGTGISREHFKLHEESGMLFITDLSSNGTWLNTRRLTRNEPHPLTSTDEIRIAGFDLRVDWQDGAPAAEAKTPEAATGPAAQAARPVPAQRPLGLLRFRGSSFSKMEGLLLALALATLTVIVLYLMSG
jgi:predicted component of type VI protein secretion system